MNVVMMPIDYVGSLFLAVALPAVPSAVVQALRSRCHQRYPRQHAAGGNHSPHDGAHWHFVVWCAVPFVVSLRYFDGDEK